MRKSAFEKEYLVCRTKNLSGEYEDILAKTGKAKHTIIALIVQALTFVLSFMINILKIHNVMINSKKNKKTLIHTHKLQ